MPRNGADENGRAERREGRPHRHHHRRHHHHVLHFRTETEISCCVKYMVFSFNVLFWLIGLAVFLIGAWAQVEKTTLTQLSTIGKLYLDPSWILVVVGLVTFIIGFSGCVGALRENTCLLAFYAALLGVLLLTQLTVAILGFVFKNWLEQQMKSELDNMIVFYRDDPDLQSVIDWIQKDWLHCCGIKGPDDWEINVYFNISSEALGSPEAGGVPFSCCKHQEGFMNLYCGHGVRKKDYTLQTGSTEYYQTGCLKKLESWANQNVIYVGCSLVIVAVLQGGDVCHEVFCDGCLRKALVWLERNFFLLGALATITLVIEVK